MYSNVFRCALQLVLSLWVSVCLADPAPTGVTGTISHGESVVISGSSFGANTLTQNWSGANIEAGTVGQVFSHTGWTACDDAYDVDEDQIWKSPRYSSTVAHSGAKSIHCDYYDKIYDSYMMLDSGESGRTEWFITAWVYLDKVDDSTVFQWKNFWVHSRTTISMVSGFQAPLWWREVNDPRTNDWSSNPFTISSVDEAALNIGYPNQNMFNPMGEWQRLELYIKKSSSDGANDGIVKFNRVDEPTYAFSNTTVVTHDEDDTEEWRYLFLGMFYGNLSGNTGLRDMNIYYDDIFVSDTQARVEIGNASTWATCTHREIQIPTAWAAGEITVTINQGALPDGEAYLYVVDANGVPNADGYEITLGEVAASGQPISGGMISGGSFQ